ncbi:EF-hand calcium-binding domain-containing protein 10 [Phaenicophaeus curvirostris]|uniref:EF-hand calcium-binding domain-containing protein 10 n=1 Tax=Phaenicophaeus curvirostris TaxID=33595 RepID=UPI0037F0EAF4
MAAGGQQPQREHGSPEPLLGERQCREYLRQHRLPELLHRLAALLLHHRPERPREFLLAALERVKAGRRAEGEFPDLLDDADLGALFGLLDVLGQGRISGAQGRAALKTLGLGTEDLRFGDDASITLDEFKEEVKKKMLESWAVY